MSAFRFIMILLLLSTASILILTGLPGRAQVSPAPPVPPADRSTPERRLLAPIKTKMADNLARLPNYTCVQTIERSHRAARKKIFERQDLVRLEVALFGGQERFAWPGAKRIEETELSKLIETGVFGTGNFGVFARAIFLTDTAEFEYAEEGAAARSKFDEPH